MTIRRVHRALAFAGTLGGLTACQSADRPRSAARTDNAIVTLIATDYDFQTPDTLPAGWTTFHLVNNGGQPHMAQLIQLQSGMMLEDFLKAYTEAFRTSGPRPEWARRLGGPTVTAPQDTGNATLFLEPGNYVWICLYNIPDGIPHVVGHGMAQPFLVEAASGARSPSPPAADIVMRLTEYAFTLSAPLTAGRHTIRVTNAGAESHEVGVLKLARGKTLSDFQAWMQQPGEGALENTARIAGGVTSLAPNADAYFEVDITPGEYVLLCLVTAPDGRSHVEHGMIQQIGVR